MLVRGFNRLLRVAHSLKGCPFASFFVGINRRELCEVVGTHLPTDILHLVPDQSKATRGRRNREPADRPSTVWQLVPTEQLIDSPANKPGSA